MGSAPVALPDAGVAGLCSAWKRGTDGACLQPHGGDRFRKSEICEDLVAKLR
jgi:hypothetical protein